jgi:nitroreductase
LDQTQSAIGDGQCLLKEAELPGTANLPLSPAVFDEYQRLPPSAGRSFYLGIRGRQPMELKDAISGRRSVRDYKATPVEESDIRNLIDAAVHAPSAINQQPWRFTVVRDTERLLRISDEAKAYLLRGPAVELASSPVRSLLDNPGFNVFYNAPVLIVISAAGPWAVEDCALAAENLMLSAHAAGLGTCWIGFAQSWLGTPEGKALLMLPETEAPVAPIIVGHPKAASAAVPRNPPRIHWLPDSPAFRR